MENPRAHRTLSSLVLATAAAVPAIAAPICCLNQVTYHSMDGNAPCTGSKVHVCDEPSIEVPSGYREVAILPAFCVTYTLGEGKLPLIAPCSSLPAGHIKLPGTLPPPYAGMCCFVPTEGLDINPVSRKFNTQFCIGEDCTVNP